MSRSSSSLDRHTPAESSINPWLWAQLGAAFLFGVLITLLITAPKRERNTAVGSAPRPAPLMATASSEQRNVSQGTARYVKPVELHRQTATSDESPRVTEVANEIVAVKPAAPQETAVTLPPVHVDEEPQTGREPHWTDLVIERREPTQPSDDSSANKDSASTTEEETPSDEGPALDTAGPTLDSTASEASENATPEANDGREAKPGDEIHVAPPGHVDPSAQDMSEVNKRQAADAEPAPVKARRELTADQVALRNKLKACVDYYYREPVSVSDYGPWGIMHALIAYGVDTNVYADGQQVNAIGWICYNGRCRGQRLFRMTSEGEIDPLIGVGVQGHPGQYLSMLAQSKVRTDYPLRIEDRPFTVADLIEREQETCRVKTELTFKLIAFAHYLDTDTKWKSDTGEDWDIPKVIREELAAPIIGAACGGTHRMTGFSYAVNKRMKEGKPIDGQWERARKYLEDFKAYTYRLQNTDGSFSSNWFAGRGDWGGPVRKLETTGHISEWLISACSEDELADPRLIRALNLLTDTLYSNRGTKWEIGPRGHGLHALVMYDERVYGARAGERRLTVAGKPAVPAPSVAPEPARRPGEVTPPPANYAPTRFFRR